MPKNKKKFLSFLLPLTFLAPVTLAASCQEEKNSINYNESAPLVDNTKGKDFFDSLDQNASRELANFSKYLFQAAYVLYDQEVQSSKKLQKGDFQYSLFEKGAEKSKLEEEIKTLNEQIKTVKNEDDKKTLQSSVDNKKEELKNVEKKIKELNENIKKIDENKIDFADSAFNVDFPLVLKPFDAIWKDQEKILKDQKAAFIKTFKTEAEGLKKWPDERRRKHGSAANDYDAINDMAYQKIRSEAFKRFHFIINNNYSIKKFIWANKTDNKNWTFLIDKDLDKRIYVNPEYKNKIIDAIKSKDDVNTVLKGLTFNIDEKVYFVSTESKDPLVMEKEYNNFLDNIATTLQLINVQHGIIPFKEGKERDEIWAGEVDDFKKMLKFTGFATQSDSRIKGMGAGEISNPHIFQSNSEADKKQTEILLKTFGKPDGTIKQYGYLGAMSILDYVKKMAPGFGLGVLEQIIFGRKNKPIKEFSAKDFALKMYDELRSLLSEKNINWNDNDNAIDKNKKIDSLFQKMNKDDIKIAFGGAIRDYINSLGEGQLVYKIQGTSNYLVFSNLAGMHIIKVNHVPILKNDVKSDLENMAKNKSVNSSTQIVNLLNGWYIQERQLQYIYNNETLKKGLQKYLDKYNAKLESEFKKSGKTLKDKDKLTLDNLKELVDYKLKAIKNSLVVNSLKDNVTKWYIGKLNNKSRDWNIKPEDIYEWAKEVA